MTNSPFRSAVASTFILAACAIPAGAQKTGDGDFTITSPNSATVIVGPDGQGIMVGPDGAQTAVDLNLNNNAGMKVMTIPGGNKGAMTIGPGGANMMVKGQPIDPQQLRQRSVEALKQQLGCNDDEWLLISPKIEKVKILQVTATSGQVLDSKDAGYDLPEAIQVRTALTEFQKIMKDENSSSARVSQALAALRDARAKARASLVQARKELTDLLTPKQEAILYQRGILD